MVMTADKPKGLLGLQALMAAGEWRKAILLAASFPRLPEGARGRILAAREAYQRPEFQRELGRNPDDLKAAGIEALQEHYAARKGGGR